MLTRRKKSRRRIQKTVLLHKIEQKHRLVLGVLEILTAAQLCNICWEPLISDLDILANDFGNLPCTVGP